MRLTLRTLLAYLDGVLSPHDALELEAKIEESEYAQQLVQRVRDVIQQSRMEAPRLEAKSPMGDPNWMSEYLDSTLDIDHVAALERFCLESDSSLAEAASCHQILSRVLQQPAKVPSRLRERLYRLGQQADGADAPGSGHERIDPDHQQADDRKLDEEEVFVDAVRLPVAPTPPQAIPVLKAKSSSSPSTSQRPLSQSPLATPETHLQTPQSIDRKATGLASSSTDSNIDESSTVESLDAPRPEWADPSRRSRPSVSWVVLGVSLLCLAVVTTLALTGTLQSWLSPTSEVTEASSAESETNRNLESAETQTSSSETTPSVENVADPIDGGRGAGASLKAPDTSAADMESSSVQDTTGRSTGTVPEGSAATAASPAGFEKPATLGAPAPTMIQRSASDTLFAIRQDQQSAWNWFHEAAVAAPFELKNFSMFRGSVQWPTSPRVEIVGASYLTVAPSIIVNNARLAEFQLHYGRVVLSGDGNPGRKIRVAIGEQLFTVTLLTPDSKIAIERRFYRPPGSSFTDGSRDELLHVIGVEGSANFEDLNGLRTFESGTGMTWSNGKVHQAGPLASLPSWINEVDRLDAMSAQQVTKRVSLTEPPTDSLARLTSDTRPEVRVCATECLVELGDFRPAFWALEDPKNRTNWRLKLMDAITEQWDQSAEQASAGLGQLLEQNASGELASQIWTGLSPADLEAGQAELLVNALDHDRLLIRSLAFQQLMAVTGTSERYLPDADEAGRRRRVLAWRARLDDSQISYAVPPAPPHLDFASER